MRTPIIVFLALLITVSAHCTCNSAIPPNPDPTRAHNAAQRVIAIAIPLLEDAPAIPHQFALVTGAMFEAFLISRGRPHLTAANVTTGHLPVERVVGYAGYAALARAVAADSEKSAILDAAVAKIGLRKGSLLETVGVPIAEAIAMKYPINIPPSPYTPPNRPSSTASAQCRRVKDPDGWQPLCMPSPSGGSCQVQAIPFLPLVNASLITADGKQKVDNLIKKVPVPPKFRRPLGKVPRAGNDFAKGYKKVLFESARLNDQRKITAEVFAPNAALLAHRLALDEAIVRKLGLRRSLKMLFTVSVGVRDAIIGSSTVKVKYSTVRPVTVLQCGFRKRKIRAWRGPYQGVGVFKSTFKEQFRSYLPTPPFPGYVSGHSAAASAAGRVMGQFFGRRPKGANCFIVVTGGSTIEGRKKRGEEGFVNGITDVVNSGKTSIGFTPATDTTVCWKSFRRYALLVARSRLFAGIHTPFENKMGTRLGRRAGSRALRFVDGLLP